ncbi:hypothetical protein PA905_18940 [Planktothrix agardhii CCAP 1459/11A]|jgi:hypothetical protein|uniref:Uncharacterized protein n=1 Tax=Planktothrix agardhii CCAP 1459/11A TaxID=282420 RepID=A0A4P5ZFV1_PLAAG|nr:MULTISPECIES: hypothetical protein [Planktothrix]CAD5919070.1 hypothetical protein NO108_00918 [Planktothrix rubescens]MCB8752421.1 hypothetical protein [Planktothrix agardhii 1810]MCP9296407.1 hypothetical protein [Planktothrix agardhii LY1]CAD0226001.1 conserved hypothetical protein [Planktothrix agardhii]CAD5949695.1 hypothetical protein NO758_02454 [Planktothrix agardhii]
MNKITLEIPDQLMNLIRDKSESIESILLKALEDYLTKESLDITKTKTWELCGSLEIPNPEPEFIVSEQNSELSTNYAEKIDQILY